MFDEQVPVLIVGGGGAGLTASMHAAEATRGASRATEELERALGQVLSQPVGSDAAPVA